MSVRWLLLPAMLCAAVAAGGCTTVATPPKHRPESPVPSQPPFVRALPNGSQRAWVHGIGVDVPGSWHHDDLRCGIPQRDTIVVTTVGWSVRQCRVKEPQRISFAWLGSFQNGIHPGLRLGRLALRRSELARMRAEKVAGVPALRALFGADTAHPLAVVLFPQRHVFLLVSSADPEVIATTVDSVQAVDVDPGTGCVVFSHGYDDVASLARPSGRTPVPGRPTSATACYYVDGWLESTAVLTGTRARGLAAAIDATPAAPVSHACDRVRQGAFIAPGPMVLQFRYGGRDVRTLVARILSCRGWQSYVSNGALTRRLDRAVLHRIPRLWGYLLPKGVR